MDEVDSNPIGINRLKGRNEFGNPLPPPHPHWLVRQTSHDPTYSLSLSLRNNNPRHSLSRALLGYPLNERLGKTRSNSSARGRGLEEVGLTVCESLFFGRGLIPSDYVYLTNLCPDLCAKLYPLPLLLLLLLLCIYNNI